MKRKNRIWNLFLLVLRMILWSVSVLGLSLFLPSLAGIRTYAVLSGSMEPEILTGSVVFVNSHERTPEIGDVITYQMGQIKVTHRVKKIHEEGYETAGDANELSDGEYVTEAQILGTVLFSIPYLGYLILYLKSFPGLMLCAFLVLLYVFLTCLIEILENKNKRGEQERNSCGKIR